MDLKPVKLVTIVAEDTVEATLLADIMSAGAKGYTVQRVQGRGLRRLRDNEWEGENVRIETLVRDDVAEAIFEKLCTDYFEKFAITAYVSEVSVVRPQKYG